MMSTRGRGGKRPVPVHIKVARVITDNCSKSQHSNGLYEDVMLYVKDQGVVTTKKRGRPKKLLQTRNVVTQHRSLISDRTKLILQPRSFVPDTTIYISTTSQKTPAAVPINISLNKSNLACKTHTYVTGQHRPATVINNPKEGTIDWPQDLQPLVDMWDQLPERQVEEVEKWLTSPLQKEGFPQVVRGCHNLVSELFPGSLDEKLEDIGEWLQEKLELGNCSHAVEKPKVVVESQPSTSQYCQQWTSMAATQENPTS